MEVLTAVDVLRRSMILQRVFRDLDKRTMALLRGTMTTRFARYRPTGSVSHLSPRRSYARIWYTSVEALSATSACLKPEQQVIALQT